MSSTQQHGRSVERAGVAAPAETFGERLRHYRLAAGLTQEALAERAGLSARGLSDLERGARRFPHPDTVHRLADALGLADADRAAFAAPSRPGAPARAGLSAEPHAVGLPSPVSSFVGRESELGELRQLLASTRLVTLTGPGGIGKTRLAIEAARGRAEDVDAVAFVELAPLAKPALVTQAVAGTLGVREQPRRRLIETLADALRPARVLLVLDNCEHVVEACAEVADALLRDCPDLAILATSRERLGVAGEAIWRVPPLPLPDPRGVSGASDLLRYGAARLFVERARAAGAELAVTPSNAAAIAELCRRLDGIPLALELAAAWAPVLSPEQIATRLDDRFQLLTRGNRTAPARQQTLRAALDWSHDLLGDAERLCLRRLAAFGGDWTLEAAEVVCADEGLAAPEVLGLLGQLVDKSLVQTSERPAAAPRYRLLATVRRYALERLEASGEANPVRRRHADH